MIFKTRIEFIQKQRIIQTSANKNTDGELLTVVNKIIKKWREYFRKLTEMRKI